MTDRMLAVLAVLDEAYPQSMTGNEMGSAVGFSNGMSGGRTSHAGKRMGTANRVNFAVIALGDRGYVGYARRRNRLSGGATCLTPDGRDYVAANRAECEAALARTRDEAARDGTWER